jgi:hypothetical protein
VKKNKKKGFYIPLNSFEFIVEYMGTHALCTALLEAGLMKSSDDGKIIPKKFEKYFPDDVAVARIFLCHSKRRFGQYYLSNEAAVSCDDEIKMHIVDKMLLHSFKKKKQTLAQFFEGFTVG